MVNGYKWYTMPLKYKELEALAKETQQKWTPDGTPNLYAFSRGNGSVTWIARISRDQKRHNFTIGRFPEVKGDVARSITPAIKIMHRQGYSKDAINNALKLSNLDPVVFAALVKGERVASSNKTQTFEATAVDWYNSHLKDGLSDGPYKRQVLQQMTDYLFPKLGQRPINEIKQKEIVEALSDTWKTKKETGRKLRGNIDRIFEWAVGQELLEFNPTPSSRMMPKVAHNVQHMASLPYERAAEFWRWLSDRPRMSIETKTGLSIALLLAKRTQEIRFMEWEHIDFDRAIWTTPADKMKMRKAHRQPITQPILAMLEELKARNGNQRYVLVNGNKPLSENAMLLAVKRFDAITVHGFRATCGTWCEENGVDREISKFIKAHQPDYLDAAYQRSDLLEQRREALQRWANYVTGQE